MNIKKEEIIEQVLLFLDSDVPERDISEYLNDELETIEKKANVLEDENKELKSQLNLSTHAELEMNIKQYMANRELISRLKKQNSEFLESIQEKEIARCLFKVGDVVRGVKYSLNSEIGAITIQSLFASINESGFINMIASGYKMNLNGTHCRNGSTTQRIILNKDTTLIKRAEK